MLFEKKLSVYSRKEYPVLAYLQDEWSHTKPFAGLRILVATPIFRNTLTEYNAFLSGGAEISIGKDSIVSDSSIVNYLSQQGFSVLTQQEVLQQEIEKPFDIIADCAGQFAACHPKMGFVELTKTGVQFYQNVTLPVYVADSGIVKQIETSLGTGDGFIRGLQSLGYKNLTAKKILVFGSGKVGFGIASQSAKNGGNVSVITDTTRPSFIDNVRVDFREILQGKGLQIIDHQDFNSIQNAILQADIIVTAIGKKSALDTPQIVSALMKSKAVFANMGVEDEYGEHIPESRVLNKKKPLNFMLEEPTHLKYIDASLALHALLAKKLIDDKTQNKQKYGLQNPPQELEDFILQITRRDGLINDEL